jgi:surfeit locus 1 family protein
MSEPSKRSLLAAAVAALAGIAVLVSLGVWQLERLAMKTALLAQIDARSLAAPKPLPPASSWAGLTPDQNEYARVTATGVLENDHEALIYRGSGNVAGALSQPGYWVMTPLRLPDGARVLINRGFIALDKKDPSTRAPAPTGEVTIVGLWRSPETRSYFTPADNPAKGEWFTRDPLAIAAALHLNRVAPFSIDEDAHAAPAGAPAGGATVIDIPNNHLSYAFTWFGLAVTLAAVFAAVVFRRRED